MCVQDLKVSRRLRPRLVSVTTTNPDFNVIPDVSRCYRVTVLVNGGINLLRWQAPGPVYANLPQSLDKGVIETAVAPDAIQSNYDHDTLLCWGSGQIGVTDVAAEGTVQMVYWEMDDDTMAHVFDSL